MWDINGAYVYSACSSVDCPRCDQVHGLNTCVHCASAAVCMYMYIIYVYVAGRIEYVQLPELSLALPRLLLMILNTRGLSTGATFLCIIRLAVYRAGMKAYCATVRT